MEDSWLQAVERIQNEFHWELFIFNVTEAFSAAPHILPELWSQVKLFRRAVHWDEPFFTYLGSFHVIVYTTVLMLCFKYRSSEVALLLISCTITLLATSAFLGLGWLHTHSHLFFVEDVNYFDTSGLFLGIVFWLPLIGCACMAQCLFGRRVLMQVRERKRVLLLKGEVPQAMKIGAGA